MITDNHMHLDRKGLYLEAVKQFKRAGGGRIILVQKPSFPKDLEGVVSAFEEMIAMCQEVRKFVECYPVIGVHPAEFDRLYNRGKKEVCYQALDVVETYVEEKKVVGMGEFGRPHYPVSEKTYAEAHTYMVEAITRSQQLGCPIQLHTESLDNSGVAELDALLLKLGQKNEGENREKENKRKVIKHFASPSVNYTQMIPSVLATESNIRAVIPKRFLMETDYIDDPKRPGAVLGPKTVPKTTKALLEKGVLTEEIVHAIEEDIVTLYQL